MMSGRWAYALSVFCLLQLRAEATLPGEDVGGAPEVRYQGRERARDRASGEVSCADVIISAFPLLLAEARVYLVDISSSFFPCCLNGKKVLLAVVALTHPDKMSSAFWGFHYPILVVRAIPIAIGLAYVHCPQ